MNKSAVYLAVFAVLCVLAGVILGANITKDQGRPRVRRQADFKRKPERMAGVQSMGLRGKREDSSVESLSGRLGLNPEQKDQVSKIFENARQDIENAGKDVRESIMQIKENTNRKILEVLDSVQKEKFQQLQEEVKSRIDAQKARLPGSRQEAKSPPPVQEEIR